MASSLIFFDYCRPLVATIKVGRYGVHAGTYLKAAQQHAHRPVKQAVISASALSLIRKMALLDIRVRRSSMILSTKLNVTFASV